MDERLSSVMRPVQAVGLYLVFVFLGGALIAPWLSLGVQGLAGIFPGLDALATKPFHRYLNRSLILLGLIGLWPFLRAADLRSWNAIGLPRRPDAKRLATWGFALGFASLASVVVLAMLAGVREANHLHSAGAVLIHSLNAALAAAVVSPMEEILFRGVLFGALRKTFHWTFALGLSSLLYSLLHFLERSGPITQVGWDSGFVVLLGMAGGFGDAQKLMPGLLNLILAGLILGLAYQRSGSLHFSIGLHAGWIFWMKTYGFVTSEVAADSAWFFGTGKLINGWLAFIILILVLISLSRTMLQSDPQTGWKERRLFS
jgi:hypothetical protein